MKKINRQNYRNILFYVIVTGVFILLMAWIVKQGRFIESGHNIRLPEKKGNPWFEFLNILSDNFGHPLAILLAQIVAIIFAARIFGWLSKKVGQPTVIGEIVAGIVLGPSLMGHFFPEFTEILFPEESLGTLQFLSQIGLILFMFIVGMELDLKIMKNRASDAVVISHASIIFPFASGLGLAYFIYPAFSPEGVPFLSFGLFIAIAMSITAFPILARIVHERGIHKTRLGAIVITCAAADDITAWCLLAAVIAIVKAGSFVSSLYTMLFAAGYVLAMVKIVRPFLKRVGDLHPSRENMSKQVVAIFFFTLILSSYLSEVIGIHALFGAFMAGVIMPENIRFRSVFIEKVEDVALVLLLPLFFVYSGLRTEIGLLDNPGLWEVTGWVILVAVAGKFIGGAFSAKFTGQSWHDSLSIGTLMNTRGLMQLVVLSIGYDLGVLSPEIFAMLVIMALVTTLMTGPVLSLFEKLFKKKESPVFNEISQISKYKILISFANPEKAKALLRLANSLVRQNSNNSAVAVMHLSPSNELNNVNIEEYESKVFSPLAEESKILKQKITTLFKISNDIYSDIPELANKGDYDLLLVGLGQSIFEGSLLGRVLGFTTKIIDPDKIIHSMAGKEKMFDRSPFEESTRHILAKANIPVGIFIDKNLAVPERVLVPVFSADDGQLVLYAQKFIANSGSQVTILDVSGIIGNNLLLKESIRSIEQNAPNHIALTGETQITAELLQHFDLMLISIEGWKNEVDTRQTWLGNIPSTLIIKN